MFFSLIENILGNKRKKSNINEQELINDINKYRIITGNNNKIFCIRDNIVVELTASSIFQYIISFSVSLSQKEQIIKQQQNKLNNLTNLYYKKQSIENTSDNSIETDNYDEQIDSNTLLKDVHMDNPYTINKMREKASLLLNLPIFITYHVNLFYYPKENDILTIENLLEDIDPNDISPLYLKFISQL